MNNICSKPDDLTIRVRDHSNTSHRSQLLGLTFGGMAGDPTAMLLGHSGLPVEAVRRKKSLLKRWVSTARKHFEKDAHCGCQCSPQKSRRTIVDVCDGLLYSEVLHSVLVHL
eukprot:355720-Amphidinium_carterae.1